MSRWLAIGLALCLGACGPKGLRARLANAEKRAVQAEAALDEAERRLDEMDAGGAEGKLRDARSALEDPDVGYYPEREMIADRLDAAERRLEGVKKEKDRRELEKKVAERKKEIEFRMEEVKRAIEEARAPEATRSRADGLKDAMEDLSGVLEDGKELEGRHGAYARFALDARRSLEQGRKELSVVQARVSFAGGPGAAYLEGRSLAQEARGEKSKERRGKLFGEARARLKSCALDGKEMLAAEAKLARSPIALDGEVLSAGVITSRCESEADSVGKPAAKKARPAAKSSGKKKLR
ncbi:MAG: hypothetical protein HYZ28_18030 [Myxococcales bacterium]|nr:hypothetical protein [Myxococcales bacterium]